MDAIITDIHGNLEALNAVLDAIRELQASRIICLGDLVCYGPDSIDCVRKSVDFDIAIAGDWDTTLLSRDDPNDWNPVLNQHIEYIRGEFDAAADSEQLYATLRSYKPQQLEGGTLFVHGTPRDKREWVFPEDIYSLAKLNRIAEHFNCTCVCGHAHINGIYRRQSGSDWLFLQPDPGASYELACADRTIVTIGSVGQPRDDDRRAAFATIDGNVVTFHRVDYDIMATVRKIRSNPGIDNMYAERLMHGR